MPYKDPEIRRAKQREYQTKHYEKKKQYYVDKAKEARELSKTDYSKLKSELKCSRCEESHPACLDFHHLQDKDHNVGEMIHKGFNLERIKEEIDKCIVLCANCHRKLHYEEIHRSEIK